jgi:hypothetical protein
LSNLFVDKISGKSGTSSGAPITLSGDTATLGSGVTIPAAGITGTLGSGVAFPAGHVIQTVSDELHGTSANVTTSSYLYLGSTLEVSITCASTSNKLRCSCFLSSVYCYSGNSLYGGFAYSTDDWTSPAIGNILGTKKFTMYYAGYATSSGAVYTFTSPFFEQLIPVPTTSPMKIQTALQADAGNVTLFQNITSDRGIGTLIIQEIQG